MTQAGNSAPARGNTYLDRVRENQVTDTKVQYLAVVNPENGITPTLPAITAPPHMLRWKRTLPFFLFKLH